MEWGPWLVTFIAGQATGLGIALAVAWVERRWRRQEVRAAEKRSRLDERFEPVRRYAMGLHGFARAASRYMRIWQHVGAGESGGGKLRQLLEQHWARIDQLMPRPEPYSLLRDAPAQDSLHELHLVVWRCHDRCLECLERGEQMTEDEANGYVADAHDHLDLMLRRMEEVLDDPDG